MASQILLVEGRRNRSASCGPLLEKNGYQISHAHTRRDALAELNGTTPDLVVVDARHLRFSASRFVQTVQSDDENISLLLLLPEKEEVPDDSPALVLRGKFTARKLLNRVKRLLAVSEGEILRAGEIALDPKRRTVMRGGKQHRLTPKQARLLEVFIRNQGRVLTRAFLMKKVWNTNFVGDTRTLEVHVHWLRKAIEEDSSNPTYLTTVRRLGYRFDVP